MLGFKIISKRDYSRLLGNLSEDLEKNIELQKRIERVEHDCKALREQNSELRQQLNEAKGSVEFGISDLKDYTILRTDSYPCENCKIESDYCKKLSFADTNICICKRDKVNKFDKRKKK